MRPRQAPLDIAVVGTGIAGMGAAWLLSEQHHVTVFEQAGRLGGHSNTVDVPGQSGPVAVDTGFIVYNVATYPNLTALFRYLDVPTVASDMSFGVSLRDGGLEYAGTDLRGMFVQRGNLWRPRYWQMLRDLLRFYREAPAALATLDGALSLDDWLRQEGYGRTFVEDHLLPMAASIWSTPSHSVGAQPAANFIRFCANHGLLQLRDRPMWRTVAGGSRSYVARLTARYTKHVQLSCGVRAIRRRSADVLVTDESGAQSRFDHVVLATHSDQALALLSDPSDAEADLLGAIRYGTNTAVLHTDASLMPRRRAAWCSWNYLGSEAAADGPSVTYWMNRLQRLRTAQPLFVTLNPPRPPSPAKVLHSETYAHPLLDHLAASAQRNLWSLQGVRRTWFCGAWFGAGFHEDGLQSGLAVAEQLGEVTRPWQVQNESGRIHVMPLTVPALTAMA